ncbi:MAG: glycosyltransferase family 39 protein [bacterium]|nr:MAG: glycosyltransferase family 39 protein [bacterium]
MLGILLLGAFLRFYRIGQQSYWVDEVNSIWQVNGHIGSPLDNMLHNFHGPIHFAFLWLWGKVGGWGEAWTRSLSALMGLVTIWLIYVLARRIAGRRVALWSALLLALSPFHVWYSQEVRNYAFLLLVVVLSMILFFRILEGSVAGLEPGFRSRKGIGVWIAFILASIAALLSNLGALFLFAGQGLFLLFRRPKLFGKLCIVLAIVCILLLPWIRNIELGWSLELLREGKPLRQVNFHPLAIPYTFMVYSVGDTVGPSRNEMNRSLSFDLFRPFIAYFIVAGAVYAMLFFTGLRTWMQRKAGTDITYLQEGNGIAHLVPLETLQLFLHWIFLPMVFVAVLAILDLKLYNVRYVSVGFPGFVIVLAAGIERCRDRLRWVLVVLVFLLTAFSLRNMYTNPRYWKPDARAAAREIAQDAQPDDVIVVYAMEEPFHFYYRGLGEVRGLGWLNTGHWHFWQMVDEFGQRYKRAWLVDHRGWYIDPEGKIPQAFDERWRFVEERRFTGIVARLYENPEEAR